MRSPALSPAGRTKLAYPCTLLMMSNCGRCARSRDARVYVGLADNILTSSRFAKSLSYWLRLKPWFHLARTLNICSSSFHAHRVRERDLVSHTGLPAFLLLKWVSDQHAVRYSDWEMQGRD